MESIEKRHIAETSIIYGILKQRKEAVGLDLEGAWINPTIQTNSLRKLSSIRWEQREWSYRLSEINHNISQTVESLLPGKLKNSENLFYAIYVRNNPSPQVSRRVRSEIEILQCKGGLLCHGGRA